MDKRECNFDRLGNEFGKEYCLILRDPVFEGKLKSFDPNLKLCFNKEAKRWGILEWALDHSGWNLIYVFEDDFGNPMPVGDWVFEHLKDMQETNSKLRSNPDLFFKQTYDQYELVRNQKEKEIETLTRDQLIDQSLRIKKGLREINNQPVSDVTAGYRKIH